jgi:hypothetical protein
MTQVWSDRDASDILGTAGVEGDIGRDCGSLTLFSSPTLGRDLARPSSAWAVCNYCGEAWQQRGSHGGGEEEDNFQTNWAAIQVQSLSCVSSDTIFHNFSELEFLHL